MGQVSTSEFYMWRTLFAMSHVDGVVSEEERRFMIEALDDFQFSPLQRETLLADMEEPQDVMEMFSNISDEMDKAQFFYFARKIVHVDGDYGSDEQRVMLELIKKHVKEVDFDTLLTRVHLHLEEENDPAALVHEDEPDKSVIGRFKALLSRHI